MKTWIWLALGAGAITGFAGRATPVEDPPLAFHFKNCARCHGEGGRNHDPEVMETMTEKKLAMMVESMAQDQAQTALTGVELEAQIAYHRSMVKKEPFLVWTQNRAGRIQGEATKGSVLNAKVGGKLVKVQQRGIQWSVHLPPNTSPSSVQVTAFLKGKSVTLNLSKSGFSHRAPL